MVPLLAQTASSRVLVWVGVTIALVLLGGLGALWIRRRFRDDGANGDGLHALSLHDLRALHARGELSDDEFEALRSSAIRAHTDGGQTPAPDARTAAPGMDLTGEPLPGSAPAGDGPAPPDRPENSDGPPGDRASS